MTERERNLRIVQGVHCDSAWNGKSFQKGDFVALLDGRIVAVHDNADDSIAALRVLEPDPKRGMVVEVSPPVFDVIRWVR